MVNDELIKQAEVLIDNIYQNQVEILNKNGIVTEKKGIMETIEKGEMNLISNEKEGNGKAKFGNSDSREAELRMRLLQNEDYKKVKIETDKIIYEKEIMFFELERRKNKLELLKVIMR